MLISGLKGFFLSHTRRKTPDTALNPPPHWRALMGFLDEGGSGNLNLRIPDGVLCGTQAEVCRAGAQYET